MAPNTVHYKKCNQPITIFYRPNPHVFTILPLILCARGVSVVFDMLEKMDISNCFEVDKVSISNYIQAKYNMDKSDANKILKRLIELKIIIFIDKKTRKSCRINPAVANRVKHLTSFWEFQPENMLENIYDAYKDWREKKGVKTINLPTIASFKRLAACIEASNKAKKSDPNQESELNNYIKEYADDVENWLKERAEYKKQEKEYQMQFAALQNEMRAMAEAANRREEEAKRREEEAKLRHQQLLDILQGNSKPEEIVEKVKRHLEIVK